MAEVPAHLAIVQPAGYTPPPQVPGPAVVDLHPSSTTSSARAEIHVAISVRVDVHVTISVSVSEATSDPRQTSSIAKRATTRVSTRTVLRATYVLLSKARPGEFSLDRNRWEIETFGLGVMAGELANTVTGNGLGRGPCVVGGTVVLYLWGVWRWRDEHR
jgi:hypothetical protein